MKHTIILSLLVLLLLPGCGEPAPEQTNEPVVPNKEVAPAKPKFDPKFTEYVKKIPVLRLPLSWQCEKQPKSSQYGLKRESINKFGVKNSRIAGKIAETENYVAVIYLYPGEIDLPIIKTTDRNGKKISELKMYDKWCGEDEFSVGTSWANISKKLTITLGDSVTIYERFEQGGIIEQTRHTEGRTRIFTIDADGKIKKRKTEVKKDGVVV